MAVSVSAAHVAQADKRWRSTYDIAAAAYQRHYRSRDDRPLNHNHSSVTCYNHHQFSCDHNRYHDNGALRRRQTDCDYETAAATINRLLNSDDSLAGVQHQSSLFYHRRQPLYIDDN